MFVSDPIMREIQNLSRLIGIVTLHKDIAHEQIVDEKGILSLSNFLRVRLRELTAQGRINDAENYLFEVLDTHVTEEKIAVALEFYTELGTLTDDQLHAAGFSREEILEGLTALSKL